MATEIIMPKLGMAMGEGTVVKWLKDDGAEVKKGAPVVVVMSKKITYEVTAPADGVVRHVACPKDVRAIGQVIGFIAAPGEPLPEVTEVTAAIQTEAEAAAEPPPVEKTQPTEEAPFVPSSPAARRLAQELGVDIAHVPPSGRRISEDDVRRYHETQSRIAVSPLARRMAEEEGVDLSQVEGTGPGGRIVEEDVLRVLEDEGEGRGQVKGPPPQSIPFVGMRQAIAEQMLHSLQSMAQLTLTTQADVTELAAAREALTARWGQKVSYTDLLIKAVAVALQDHPLLGAKLRGDEIVLPDEGEIHIGVAVALDDGLIVPVVRRAGRLTVLEISEQVKTLAQEARENQLDVDEVTGAAFTITNLGMYGIDAFTPIINPPEVAILGVGRIVETLTWRHGQVVPRAKLTLSLTLDHRVVDGAPGAAFLQTLVQLLEHPALIFAGRGKGA